MIRRGGMAVANQFAVELPSMAKYNAEDMNILCKDVSLPGRQITTIDRYIGVFNEKIASGFVADEVTMTFITLNDYGTRKYFDEWMNLIVATREKPSVPPPLEGQEPVEDNSLEIGQVGYKVDYQRKVVIRQLRKPQFRKGFDLGPINIDFDLMASSIYSVELIDAFPTAIASIPLSNELDGLVEVSVQLAYTNWRVIKDERKLLGGSVNVNFGGLI